MGGPRFTCDLSWMLVNDCLGSNALPWYKSRGQDVWPWRKKGQYIAYKGSCPFDRVLPEQTAVTWIKSVPVWL